MRPHRARILALGALVLSFAIAPASAHAAIGFVAATSSATAGGGATSLAITKPTGVAAGDVMVATITATGVGALTAPGGWIVIQDTTQGTAIRQITWYKIAAGSQPNSYLWTLGSTRQASGGIVDYSGVNNSAPVDASADASGASGNAVAVKVTTSLANDQLIVASGFNVNTTVTAPSGVTERYDVPSPSTTNEAGDFTHIPPGPTAPKTMTPAISSSAWIAHTVALRDASQTTLSVRTTAAPTFSADLNIGDQIPTYTAPLTVDDGDTAGWNLTITSTPFTATGGETLAADASTVTAVSSACVANGGTCADPTNSLTYPVNVPAGASPPAANKFFNAANTTGVGSFTVTPTIGVSVPQNSYADTYTSTVTIAAVSGP